MSTKNKPLIFSILKECETTKARVSKMMLPHGEVDTPVFMPVGTQVTLAKPFYFPYKIIHFQGTLKGMLPEQLKKMGLQIMLANTYHLGTKPVMPI